MNPRRVHPGEVEREIAVETLIPSPQVIWDRQTLARCQAIFETYVAPLNGRRVPDAAFCDLPRWVFLEYAAQFRGLLLAGVGRQGAEHLDPIRLSINLIGFELPRHYAYDNGFEAIFDAILDVEALRERDCELRTTIALPAGSQAREKRFYYALDYRALPHGPWRDGAVYLYRSGDLPEDFRTRRFVSTNPILPVAWLNVRPKDWPLLAQVDGTDPVAQTLRAWDGYSGFPWRGDVKIHPNLKSVPIIDAARRYVDERWNEPISLERLGKHVGVSPFAALRMFRARLGVSPREYQLGKRIDRCKALLREGISPGMVAIDAGFCDQAHFIRLFRKDVGMTPGEYLRAQESSIRA